MSIFQRKMGKLMPEAQPDAPRSLAVALSAQRQARKPTRPAPVELPETEDSASSIAEAIVRRRQQAKAAAETTTDPIEDDGFEFEDLDEMPLEEAPAAEPTDMVSAIRAKLRASRGLE